MKNLKWADVNQDRPFNDRNGHQMFAARVPGGWVVRHGESIAFVPRIPWWRRWLT